MYSDDDDLDIGAGGDEEPDDALFLNSDEDYE